MSGEAIVDAVGTSRETARRDITTDTNAPVDEERKSSDKMGAE